MAEDKVLQSEEELGLKSESSSGERKHISTNCSSTQGKDGQIHLIFNENKDEFLPRCSH